MEWNFVTVQAFKLFMSIYGSSWYDFILQVEFVAVMGAQPEGLLGIDDIVLVTGACDRVYPNTSLCE